MLDVKQLRVLKAVGEHGSFSAAAEALSFTQPAISQQVAALEKQAGTTLVDRTSRGVRLTDAGLALVDHAEVVLARLAAAEAGGSGSPPSRRRAPRSFLQPSPCSRNATRRSS